MKRAKAKIWTIIYFVLGTLPFLVLCLWFAKEGWFPDEKTLHEFPDLDHNFYRWCKSMALAFGIFALLTMIPIWISIRGNKNPYINTKQIKQRTDGLLFVLTGIGIALFCHFSNISHHFLLNQDGEVIGKEELILANRSVSQMINYVFGISSSAQLLMAIGLTHFFVAYGIWTIIRQKKKPSQRTD